MFDKLEILVVSLSTWVRPHLASLGTAAVATLLVLYGESVYRLVRRRTGRLPWVARLVVFVAVCAFGYAGAAVFAGHLVARLLGRLGDVWLAPVVGAVFLLIGVTAERRGSM